MRDKMQSPFLERRGRADCTNIRYIDGGRAERKGGAGAPPLNPGIRWQVYRIRVVKGTVVCNSLYDRFMVAAN